MYKKKKRTDIE